MKFSWIVVVLFLVSIFGVYFIHSHDQEIIAQIIIVQQEKNNVEKFCRQNQLARLDGPWPRLATESKYLEEVNQKHLELSKRLEELTAQLYLRCGPPNNALQGAP